MAAVTKIRDDAGALNTIQKVNLRDPNGVVRDIITIRVRDDTKVSRLVFQKPGTAPGSPGTPGGLKVDPAPNALGWVPVSFYQFSKTPKNLSVNAAVTASGGTPPYTYQWTYNRGDTPQPTCSPPNAAAVTFSATLTPPASVGAWWDCVVTDANGIKISLQFAVELNLGLSG